MKLSIMEYMKYLGGSEFSKCVVEGENVINAGHLILAGKTGESSEMITVYGLCLQSSSLESLPHEITGELSLGVSVNIRKMLCSCKAGNSGRCKHVSAFLIKCIRCIKVQKKALSCKVDFEHLIFLVLIYLFRFCFLCSCFREDVDSLEFVSSTDRKCVWSTQKHVAKEKYRPVPVQDMPCFKDKVNICDIIVDDNEIRNYFVRILPNSAIAKHRKGRHEELMDVCSDTIEVANICHNNFFVEILNNSCQSPLMMYLASVDVPVQRNCCAHTLANINDDDPLVAINIPQHSVEWKQIRKYRITGSRCYEIYTYSNKDWKNKALKYFNPPPLNNKYIKHGLLFENNARDLFAKISKMDVVECGVVIPDGNKWLGYSPDGVIFFNNQPQYLLEIKCIFEGKTKTITDVIKKVKYITEENGEYKLKKHHKYYGQIQMGMAVLNLPKTYFILYASFDDSILIIDVEFDYHFALQMLSKLKCNYFNHMLHEICDK